MLHDWIAHQFRRPSGVLGQVVTRLMEKGNLPCNRKILELLNIQNEDTVLEIGFGPGLALAEVLERHAGCRVTGIDFSPLSVSRAAHRNAQHIRSGRLQLVLGDFGRFAFPDALFSKVFGVNVVYFWPELEPMARRLHRILKPGGQVILYMTHRDDLLKAGFTRSSVFNHHEVTALVAAFTAAGFDTVSAQEHPLEERRGYCVTASKG